MRKKTRGCKHRARVRTSNPSISLPRLYQDEANEEYHIDGNDCSSKDNDDVGGGDEDKKEGEGDGFHGDEDHDNVVNPDSVEEVDRRAGENNGARPSIDCIVVDWLEQEFCVRCGSGSGQLLVCSENSCPIAIHEACMNCKSKFNNEGKFYCHYCWFKHEVARTKELRTKAMLAKRELSNFICLKRDHGNEEKQEDETQNMKATSVPTMTGKINTSNRENGLNDDENERTNQNQEQTPRVQSINREKSAEERNSRAYGFENVGDGESVQEEDIENASDSEDDEIDKDRWRIQPSSTNHSEIVKGTLHVSINGTDDILGVLEENQGKRGKAEQVLRNAVGNIQAQIAGDATSKMPAIDGCEFVLRDLHDKTLAVEENQGKRRTEELVLRNAVGNIQAQITEDATFKMPAIGICEFVSPDLDYETPAVEENQGKRGKEEPVLPNALGITVAQLTGDATSKMPAIDSCEFVSPDFHGETLAVEENQGKWRKEEPVLPNAVGTTMAQISGVATSKMPAIESFDFVSTDLDNETLAVEENQGKRGKEEPLVPNAVGTTMEHITSNATSRTPAIESFEFISPDLDNETLTVRIKHVKRRAQKRRLDSPSFESSTSAKDTKMNQQGEATAGENSMQYEEPTKRLVIPTLGTDLENETPTVDNMRLAVEENQGERGKEEPVLPNAVGTTMEHITSNATSKMPATESFEFMSPDLDDETLTVRIECVKRRAQKIQLDSLSSESSTGAKYTKMKQEGKATAGENSVQCEESTKRLVIPTLGTDLVNETPTVHQKRIKRSAQKARSRKVDSPQVRSSEPSTSVKDMKIDRQGKATAGENSMLCDESTKQLVISALVADSENETPTMHLKPIKQSAQKEQRQKVDSPKTRSSELSTSSNDTQINQQRKATGGENYVQCQESTKQLMIPLLGTDLKNATTAEPLKCIKPSAQRAWPQKVDLPKIPSSEPSTTARNTEMNSKRKATAGENSVQCQESTNRVVISRLGNEKRRRLHWRVEEEDMLKEGVRRFSTTVNKNIPWRKILEFGHHVFHETRTPVDLKDKWKNIMAKDTPKSNRGVLI